jgi:hypothetical protein
VTYAGSALVALAGAAALAGCGSSSTSSTRPTAAPAVRHPVIERSYGKGANRVWVFRKRGEDPRAVVVFLHGLYDRIESTPLNHLDWLHHLARQNDAVLYPQFEAEPGAPLAVLHALKGIVAGMQAVNPVVNVPIVFIGYSRGAGLAVDVAALSPQIHVRPSSVLSVFPAMLDPPVDYTRIPAGTRIVFLVGDRDTTVSHLGRDQLVRYLRQSHSKAVFSTVVIHSTPTFTADHGSPMLDTAGARAAFWDRADRLVDAAVRGK